MLLAVAIAEMLMRRVSDLEALCSGKKVIKLEKTKPILKTISAAFKPPDSSHHDKLFQARKFPVIEE